MIKATENMRSMLEVPCLMAKSENMAYIAKSMSTAQNLVNIP